jgi:uncharacterized protein with FMN-binding domain
VSKKNGIRRVLLVVAILLVGIGVTAYTNIQEISEEVKSIQIQNIDLSNVRDGVYTGEYSFKDLVGAKVKVTVKDNEISNITLVEHKNGLGKKAESITDSVIGAQSLEVDVVSGATASSTIILKAIENAFSR